MLSSPLIVSTVSMTSPRTSPAGAPSIGAADAPPLPADSFEQGPSPSPGEAFVLIPRSDGSYSAIHKLPCDDPRSVIAMRDASGVPIQVLAASERGAFYVSCLESDGTERWRTAIPAGEKVAPGGVLADEARGRVLVRSGRTLLALDAADGQEKARRDFGEVNFTRCVVVRSSGEIDVTEEERLLRLDGDLRDVSSEDAGMRVEQARELGDGSLFLFADNCPAHLVVMRPDGARPMDEHYAGLHSTTTDEHGNIWTVDDRDLGTVVNHRQKNVVRYRVEDGSVLRFPATDNADGLLPRRDGSVLVYDDALAKPAFVLFDATGKRCATYRFDHEGFAREVWLSDDQRNVFVVLDRNESDQAKFCDKLLYHFQMPEPGSESSSALGRLFPSLQGQTLKPIHTHVEGPRNGWTSPRGIMPAGLSDGRVVVFKEDQILVLGADGHQEATYPPDLGALLKGLGDADFTTRRVCLDMTQAGDLVGRKAVLEAAARRFGYAPPPEAGEVPRPGEVDVDGCVSYPYTVAGDEAVVAAGAAGVSELQEVLLQGRLLDFALRDQVEMDFPNALGKVAIKPNEAVATVDDGSGQTVKSRRVLEDPTIYTAALPVAVGQRPYLVAGTSDGRLLWQDVLEGRWNSESRTFTLGAPVQRIDLVGETVRAIGNDGRVLLFRPPGSEDLRATAPDTGGGSGASSGTALTGANAGTGIVVEPDRVILGGVAISRRTT